MAGKPSVFVEAKEEGNEMRRRERKIRDEHLAFLDDLFFSLLGFENEIVKVRHHLSAFCSQSLPIIQVPLTLFLPLPFLFLDSNPYPIFSHLPLPLVPKCPIIHREFIEEASKFVCCCRDQSLRRTWVGGKEMNQRVIQKRDSFLEQKRDEMRDCYIVIWRNRGAERNMTYNDKREENVMRK